MFRTRHNPAAQRSTRPSRPQYRVRLRLEQLEDRVAPALLTVTTTGDDLTANDASVSLREAIAAIDAGNNLGDPDIIAEAPGTFGINDTIQFNIAGSAPFVISVGSDASAAGIPLPQLTKPMTIDGTSQFGFAGTPLIVLDGTNAGSSANGLSITAGNCTVKGLVIDNFTGAGILLQTGGGNVVTGNYIGVDSTGATAAGNGGDGIAITGSSNNTIGGTTAASRNIISGNSADGVEIFGGSTTGNVIEGNYIGTDVNGTANTVGNGSDGVAVHDGANGNTIGGTATGAGNLISANAGNGIDFFTTGTTNTSGTVVAGNFIGTNVSGSKALGNGNDGVLITTAQATTGQVSETIGGTAAGARNVISGNTANGVEIFANGNHLLGNYIGTDVSGTAGLGNGNDGILVFVCNHNTIGGSAAGAGNVISANTANGVEFTGSSGTFANLLQGNYIGTDATGTAALGNSGDGVVVSAGTSTSQIGENITGNVISANSVNGVEIFGSSTNNNGVTRNFIGTDVSGTSALGNGNDGVAIHDGASGTTVSSNVISANTANGVEIFTTSATTQGNRVQGNLIGTNKNATGALGNGTNGLLITTATNNPIGGTGAGTANVIANSGNDGVKVDTGTGNAIRHNSIHDSANLGIELVNSGNNNQPAPTLASAASDGSNTFITGTLSAAASTTYALDFFASPSANASGAGEGRQFLGAANVTTNASGTASFTVAFAVAVPAGQAVSATATDPGGNTSVFAQDVTAAAQNWTALGPASLSSTYPASENFSGRVAGIAPSPTDANTIYLAAAGGGVWKTTNGGSTWTPLTDNQATLSMGAIAVAPSNASVIYAGTGEANNSGDSNYGRGILVSTDGGSTWTLTGNSVFNRLAIAKIAIDPTDPKTAYAAVNDFDTNGPQFASGTGIYKTTNSGATWTNLTSSISQYDPYSDVVIDPNSHNTVYMAVGDPDGNPYATGANGVYKSTDGGSSWTKLGGGLPTTASTMGRITLAVAPSNSAVVYVSISGTGNSGSTSFGSLFKMMRSDNGGSSWTDLTSGTPNYMYFQGWYDTTLIVDPSNSAIVYAGGAAGPAFSEPAALIRSTNSGASWSGLDLTNGSTTPHADHHAIAFDANGKLLDGDDGGIFRLDSPSPVQWSDLNDNLNTIQFEGIDISPTSANVVIGGSQDNGTDLYSGNSTWTETDGGDGGFAKFSPTDASRVYHNAPADSFGSNFFRRSDDGGKTWTTKTSSISADVNNQNFYAPFVVDPGNGDRVLFGTNRIWETTDGGDSWSAISNVLVGTSTFIDAIGLAASDSNTVYASFGGEFTSNSRIFVTSNHGTTWTEHDLPSGSGRVNDLEVDPNNAQVAYAVVSQFTGGGKHVFRTTNGGGSWTDISGNLPDLPTWSLQIDKLASGDVLFIGNDDGVYRSLNLGGSWSRLGVGLAHAQALQLALNSNLQVLGAATHGRGMWELLLAGSSSSSPVSPSASSPSAAVPALNASASGLTSSAILGTLSARGADPFILGLVQGTADAAPAPEVSFAGIAADGAVDSPGASNGARKIAPAAGHESPESANSTSLLDGLGFNRTDNDSLPVK